MMKKVFFKQRNLKIGECNGILSKSFPAGKDFCPNSGDEKKRNHEIFGVFQNLEKIFSQNIFSKKKKFLK